MTNTSAYFKIKQIWILFFVLASVCVRAAKKAELAITITDCRDSNKSTRLPELKILKNGKEFKTYKSLDNNIIVLKDLELGTYTLEFKSLFGKEENIVVEIAEYKRYETILCSYYLDYSKESYKPFFDQLKDNESYSIIFKSEGCFHSTEDSITIRRKKDIYKVNWCSKSQNNRWRVKSKKLNKKDIDAIRHFEIELNYMANDDGCTTIDYYVLNFNGITQQISDGSCDWNGGYYLKEKIFGNQ